MKKNVITHMKPLVSDEKYYITRAFIHLLYSEYFHLAPLNSQEKEKNTWFVGAFLFLGALLYIRIKS